MKKLIVCLTAAIGMTLSAAQAQDVAIKTNALYWLATTPNVGLEVAMGNQWTLELAGAYNPWTFKDNKRMRFWLAQPEAKYWLCEKFEGHFLGLHLHGAQFYGGFTDKLDDGYLPRGGLT